MTHVECVTARRRTLGGQGVGFMCKETGVVLRDSSSYLDHINGKKQQKALGLSMRVERSTAGLRSLVCIRSCAFVRVHSFVCIRTCIRVYSLHLQRLD